jgi:serine/threonine protein kinase
MAQSELVDYSINDEDLAFVKDRNARHQLLEFKSHLKTAMGPEGVVDIDRYIAKGTAGWVFKVTVKKTGETKAMKVLRMTQVRTGVREWYASKLLRSMALRNVVLTEPSVFVLERDTAQPLVMDQLQNAGPVCFYACFLQDFMSGGTLESLREDNRLQPKMMLKALHDVACTLAAMHAKGIQHRDVKPENILVELQGNDICAKLCDFGSCEIGDDPKGCADDVRRLGITLFALVTGEMWTKARLLRQDHNDLVARLSKVVENSDDKCLLRMPTVLHEIFDRSPRMERVAEIFGQLRGEMRSDLC